MKKQEKTETQKKKKLLGGRNSNETWCHTRQRGEQALRRRTGGRLEGEALGSPRMAARTAAVEATLEGLLEKRPEPRQPRAQGRGPGPGASRKHLQKALRRASKVGGPGPSGSRGAHWVVVLQAPAAFEALARVADRIAAADLPEEVVDGLAPACLHPLKKKCARSGLARSCAGGWGGLSWPGGRRSSPKAFEGTSSERA